MDANNHIDTALRNGVDRIVIKHEARDELNGEIREIYAELKDAGFNVTVVRGMVREQRMDPEARNAMYQQQEEYRIKLGLLAAIGPLGEAAVARELSSPTPVEAEPRRRRRSRKDAADLWSAQADQIIGNA